MWPVKIRGVIHHGSHPKISLCNLHFMCVRPPTTMQNNSSSQIEPVALSNCVAQIVGTTKGDHFAYITYVETETDQWTVYRRYSEFRELRNELLALVSMKNSCSGGCQFLKRLKSVHFPRKHLFHANHASDVINHRIVKLNVFLSTLTLTLRKCSWQLLAKCEKSECQVTQILKKFFAMPGHALTDSCPNNNQENHQYPCASKTRVGKMFPPSTMLYYGMEQPQKVSCAEARLLYTILEEQEMHHPHVA